MLEIKFPFDLDDNQIIGIHNIMLWKKWKRPFLYKLIEAIRHGFDRFIYHKVSKLNKYHLNRCLKTACRYSKFDIIDLVIKYGANNWNMGLNGACMGGHVDIISMMIQNGANNWNSGLTYACAGGHFNIIRMMFSKGANNYDRGLYSLFGGAKSDKQFNIDICKRLKLIRMMSMNMTLNTEHRKFIFGAACYGGSIKIISMLIKKGYNYWDIGLKNACLGNNLDIVQLMIEKGATHFDLSLYHACYCYYIDMIIIHFLIEKIESSLYSQSSNPSKKCIDCWNKGLYYACSTGNIQIVRLMIQKGATVPMKTFDQACITGNVKIVRLLIENIEDDNLDLPFVQYEKNLEYWNRALLVAAQNDNLKIVKLMIEKGAKDLNTAFDFSIKSNNKRIIEYLESQKQIL